MVHLCNFCVTSCVLTCLSDMNHAWTIVWVNIYCMSCRQNLHICVFLFRYVHVCVYLPVCSVLCVWVCLRTAEKSMPTLSMWSSTSCWEQLSIFCSTFLTNASTSTMLSLVMLVETVGRMECKQIALRKQTHLRGRANCMRTIFPLNCDWCLQTSIFTFHGVLWRR